MGGRNWRHPTKLICTSLEGGVVLAAVQKIIVLVESIVQHRCFAKVGQKNTDGNSPDNTTPRSQMKRKIKTKSPWRNELIINKLKRIKITYLSVMRLTVDVPW